MKQENLRILISNFQFNVILVVLVLFAGFSTVNAEIITVDDDGVADFNNIQAAINDANDGDEVVIQPGTYTGEGNRNIDFLGKAITVRSTDPNDPNVVASTVIDCNGSAETWYRGFYFHSGEDANSVLSGLTITNGYGRGGAGISLRGSSPIISDCVLSYNTAALNGGGGVELFRGNPTFTRCRFIRNGSLDYRGGGAIIIYKDSSAVLYECLFVENRADVSGGAIFSVTGNGISPKLVIDRCKFLRNRSEHGGAIVGRYENIKIRDCEFISNLATVKGGAIYSSGSVNLERCLLKDNSVYESGGGMYLYAGEATAVNCTFIRNRAGQSGGGIANDEADTEVINCSFVGNESPAGSGISSESSIGYCNVTNCILWDDANEVLDIGTVDVNVTYSDVYGGWAGTGNIDADPCFAFAENLRLMGDSPCIDAGVNSPVVGFIDTDMAGNPRIIDGNESGTAVVDMGAYEFVPGGPYIVVSRESLEFVKGRFDNTQSLFIRNSGTGVLNWQVAADCNWIEVAPANGVSTGDINEVMVTIDPNGLDTGHHECRVQVFDLDAINTPVVVDVSLYVPYIRQVPLEYETIQAAIDAAQDYDEVVISPGIYTGDGNRDLDFDGKPIIVRSVDPADPCVVESTVIDCNGTEAEPHRGFYFRNYEDANSVVDGLTIRRGYAGEERENVMPWGAGIHCFRAGPTIRNCLVTESNPFNNGCAIAGSSGPIIGCEISRNYGAGISGCSGAIANCLISGNRYSGIFVCNGTITNCVITDNGGGLYSCFGSISNCTISYNKGRAITFWPDPNFPIPDWPPWMTELSDVGATEATASSFVINPQLTNCIIWCNDWEDGIQILLAEDVNLTVSYSNIEGGTAGVDWWFVGGAMTWGSGNIDDWPALTYDGHLQSGSVCIDAGDPNGSYIGQSDIDGETRVWDSRVDIGADEYIDTDTDGLPDWWEQRYFGDPCAAEANDDAEPDGYTNLVEYKSSSDPTAVTVGSVYYVDSNRPDDYGDGLSPESAKRTIQAAINAASPMDTIEVAQGTYSGSGNCDLKFFGKMLTVRSEDPTDAETVTATIIDCNGSETEPRRGFSLKYGEGPYSVIDGFTITRGFADYGGAVLCYESSPMIKSCNITGNIAKFGGGIDCNQGDPSIIDCNISGNVANEAGGGIYLANGSSPVIEGCMIQYNRGVNIGGGICGVSFRESQPSIFNCAIRGNSVTFFGGGVVNCGGSIRSCIVSGNKALSVGGIDSFRGFISNLTMVGNSGLALFRCGPYVYNSILRDNQLGVGNAQFVYCNVEGGSSRLGCIDVDPCFVEAGFWDANGTPGDESDDYWVEGDYHLKSQGWRWDESRGVWTWDDVTSLCIDAGNPGSALGDELLSVPSDPDNEWGENIRINMGAYGRTAEASMGPIGWALLSDMNNDGVVNFADVGIWAGYWLEAEDELPGDLDRNGVVDGFDYALLGADFGK